MKQAYQESPLVTTEAVVDPLESLARLGAQRMLQAALEEEVESYLQRARYQRKGVAQGYRSGYLPERAIILGSGAVSLKVPRVSDEPSGEKFQSRLVKPYQKRSQAVDALFPRLFIEGLATRDFEPALRALLGAEAALSPSTVSRLNQQFKEEYAGWLQRQLTETFVYVYADGLYVAAGVGDEKACLLIVIGVDTSGRKHFLALQEGYRESKESWLGVLRDLQRRGLQAPALAIGDGALGFWAALGEVFPLTKQQLCWLHKMRNLLDKLPKKEHGEAVQRLRALQRASSRGAAEKLGRQLIADWRKPYPAAASNLEEHLTRLLNFYDYPSEHWRHLRTSNIIESPFAAVRLRTDAAKRFRTVKSGVHLIWQLLLKQEKKWLRFCGAEKCANVLLPA
ncbi:MAG: IS256 family transposase [Acidobacteria bacterium]|nr:IS256 family transposase [Acidobacteriota bacterium]